MQGKTGRSESWVALKIPTVRLAPGLVAILLNNVTMAHNNALKVPCGDSLGIALHCLLVDALAPNKILMKLPVRLEGAKDGELR